VPTVVVDPSGPRCGCQIALQQTALLDHLVGARQQHRRHFEAQRLRSFEVDRQLKFVRRLSRKFSCIRAVENAIDISSGMPVNES
jgi:hypothetical protein